MQTTTDRWSGPSAPGTPEAGEPGAGPAASGPEVACWRPRVEAAFMKPMRTDDAPCRPKGIAFHSNWPSWERELVFHQSAARSST